MTEPDLEKPDAVDADAPEDESDEESADASADTSADLPDGPVVAADDEAASKEAADGPADPPVDPAAVEALLFSTHHPLTASRLADVLELPTSAAIKGVVARLNRQYEQGGRCFRIEQVAGGYQMLTLPEHGELVARLNRKEADVKLTAAAQETLAVVAYKQPVLRTDVEAIRGVGCGETIRSLMEKRLVKIAGRAELPGRPILYGTTKRFLETFGLNTLKDLPKAEK